MLSLGMRSHHYTQLVIFISNFTNQIILISFCFTYIYIWFRGLVLSAFTVRYFESVALGVLAAVPLFESVWLTQ